MEIVPIAQPTVKQQEQTLLAEIATTANVDSWKDLRWFAVGGDNPRSIVIVKRGSKPVQTVCTISRTNNAQAWESWKEVLAQLQTERGRTNKKRVDHSTLPTGKI